jgi:hypothetical protein
VSSPAPLLHIGEIKAQCNRGQAPVDIAEMSPQFRPFQSLLSLKDLWQYLARGPEGANNVP